MELELCKETYSCYEALPPLVETREQSTETIVPDYCPDIARIVEGSGCLFVRSREIADGRVSVSGSLRVTLLYIADGSGGLKSFSYTLPVEETLDGRLREGCTEASVSGCVSALEVRALNPRKIMTRAAVELTVTPYCAAQLTACGDVTQRAENGIETLCETQEVSIIKALRSKDFVFSDDLVLSSSKEPAAELLRESASVRTTECRLIGGKIILKGVVCVEVLYLSESGTICSAAAELPFSQIVEGVEDADENTSAEAMLCLTGAELRIGGESGDARTISAKLFLHAFVVLRQRLCLRCITDLYSTSCDLSAQMQTLELCGGVETVTQEQNVREQIETGVEVSAVLCAEVHFGSVSLVQEESTANVRCTAILRVLYLDEGGAPLMVERRTEVAARIAVPEGCTAAVRSVTACEVSAAATANGIEVDLCLTERTGLLVRFRSRSRLVELVQLFNHKKDHKCHNQEIDHFGDEQTVADRGSHSLCFLESGIVLTIQRDEFVGEINATGQKAERRHDDIFNERFDKAVESTADDNADSEIDHVAL